MINIFHDNKYITLCNFGDRNMTQLIVWHVQLTLTLKMTVFVQGWPQVLQPIQGFWKSMLSYLDTMFLRK